MSLIQRISLCYVVPRVTSAVEEDIKQIKRINQILQRLDKTGKDIHLLETFNCLKSLKNIFDLNKLFLIICELVDIQYHETIAFLIEEIENLDSNQEFRIIKKFQELVKDE